MRLCQTNTHKLLSCLIFNVMHIFHALKEVPVHPSDHHRQSILDSEELEIVASSQDKVTKQFQQEEGINLQGKVSSKDAFIQLCICRHVQAVGA